MPQPLVAPMSPSRLQGKQSPESIFKYKTIREEKAMKIKTELILHLAELRVRSLSPSSQTQLENVVRSEGKRFQRLKLN